MYKGLVSTSPSKGQRVSRFQDLATKQNRGDSFYNLPFLSSGFLVSILTIFKLNYRAAVQNQDGRHVGEINNQVTLTQD